MTTFCLYMHGDYNVVRGQKVMQGQKIGTSNGKFNFIPHNHVSIFEGTFYSINNEGNCVVNFFSEKPWNTIDPNVYINNKNFPNKSYLNPGGYTYLQSTPYNWYLGHNAYNHDGIDFSVNGNIGEDLFSIVNGVVLDTYVDKYSTYLLIQIQDANELNQGETIMLDYSKRFLVKFVNLQGTYLKTYCDSSCNIINETLKIQNDDQYYITKDTNSGNYVLELNSFYIVFIKREAVELFSEYV